MGVNVDKIKSELNLKPFGQKGWVSNNEIECPECSRKGKFGIKFTGNSGVAHCFFCDYSKSIYNFLKNIDRGDLIDNEVEFSIEGGLKRLISESEIEIKDQKKVTMPMGCKLLLDDDYLNDRGFLPEHYKLFEPCFTNFLTEKKLHDYIIFKIYQNGNLASWLARSRKSYQWHADNIKKFKDNEADLVLRYRNSEGTEFDKILGGFDHITEETHTVILVEGLFDKVGVDNAAMLYSDKKIRCCFTFGNKVSSNQIELLRSKKNIKNVILIYDYGTIRQSKSYSLILNKYFNVLVGVPENPDIDPGDMSSKQLSDLFLKLQNPIDFYMNNLNSVI